MFPIRRNSHYRTITNCVVFSLGLFFLILFYFLFYFAFVDFGHNQLDLSMTTIPDDPEVPPSKPNLVIGHQEKIAPTRLTDHLWKRPWNRTWKRTRRRTWRRTRKCIRKRSRKRPRKYAWKRPWRPWSLWPQRRIL